MDPDPHKTSEYRVMAGVIGLILLLVAQYLSYTYLTQKLESEDIKAIDELAKEIGFALVIAAILVFTTERKSKVEVTRLFEEQISRLNTQMGRRLSEIHATIEVTKVPEEIRRSAHKEITLIGNRVYEGYLNGLRAIPNGFHLDETNWVLESNRIFYDSLNDSECRNFEVRITHTGAIRTWLEDDAKRTLEQQQRLCIEKNVKIIRIKAYAFASGEINML